MALDLLEDDPRLIVDCENQSRGSPQRSVHTLQSQAVLAVTAATMLFVTTSHRHPSGDVTQRER